MSVIKVENLSFSYPSSGDVIFDNVCFAIDTDWKLGLIGRNGRGKTTLLDLMRGKYAYGGSIKSSATFDYFPYEIKDGSRVTEEVLREVCPAAEDWRLLRELNLLDVDLGVLYRPFDTLSEGERTKVMLAAMFCDEHKFMLIDEPTNHLDAAARARLSAYLRGKSGFIVVSHDRRFLDGCVDHILSINKSDIVVRNGNFSSYMRDFERTNALERRTFDSLKTDIKRLQQSMRRTEGWANAVEKTKNGAFDSGYVGHKAAKMMKRAKTIEARQQKQIEQKSALLKNVEAEVELAMKYEPYRAERLAQLFSVAPVYGGREVCAPTSFEIMRGERIALDGKNGCGKSSILKLICGVYSEHTGRLSVSGDLKISYVPQDVSGVFGSLEDFARENGVDYTSLLTLLKKAGFERRQFEKDISGFSDGQKKMTLIAKSLLQPADLYVWDEPLNYIDVYSRMALEKTVEKYAPTMIFVEHDAAFREKIATRIISV